MKWLFSGMGVAIGILVALLPYQGSAYAVVSQSGATTLKQVSRAYEPMTISTANPQGIAP